MKKRSLNDQNWYHYRQFHLEHSEPLDKATPEHAESIQCVLDRLEKELTFMEEVQAQRVNDHDELIEKIMSSMNYRDCFARGAA